MISPGYGVFRRYARFVAPVLALAVLLVPIVASAQITPLAPDCGSGGVAGEPACNFCHLIQLAERIMDFVIITIAIPVAALLFAWAGLLFMTSGDNPGKREKGKGIFVNVLIGFVIMLGSWLLVDLLMQSLVRTVPSGSDTVTRADIWNRTVTCDPVDTERPPGE